MPKKLTLKQKLVERFELGPECFHNDETDLCVLPPDDVYQAVMGHIRALGYDPFFAYSNVPKQGWQGKLFINVPFAHTEGV